MFENQKPFDKVNRRDFLGGAVGLSASMLAGEAVAQEQIEVLNEIGHEEALQRGMDPKVLDYADIFLDASDVSSRGGIGGLGTLLLKFKSFEVEGKRTAFVDPKGNTFIINTFEGSDIEGIDLNSNREVIPNVIKSTPSSTYKVEALYFPALLHTV